MSNSTDWQGEFDKEFPECKWPDTFTRDQWNKELPAIKDYVQSQIDASYKRGVGEREK